MNFIASLEPHVVMYILSSISEGLTALGNVYTYTHCTGEMIHTQYTTALGNVYTVEVVSLHTLRLESLKLVFQPLHKFLVNKL